MRLFVLNSLREDDSFPLSNAKLLNQNNISGALHTPMVPSAITVTQIPVWPPLLQLSTTWDLDHFFFSAVIDAGLKKWKWFPTSSIFL